MASVRGVDVEVASAETRDSSRHDESLAFEFAKVLVLAVAVGALSALILCVMFAVLFGVDPMELVLGVIGMLFG